MVALTPLRIRVILIISLALNAAGILAYGIRKWPREPAKFDYNHVQYELNRNNVYKILPIKPSDEVFIGDSQTQRFDLLEFLGSPKYKNRGIDGDVTMGVYNRIDDIINGKPAKIFIEIGINDLRYNIPEDISLSFMEKTINRIKQVSPQSRIYIQSVFPANVVDGKLVAGYNRKLSLLCDKLSVTYIDIYHSLADGLALDKQFDCGDGLHLSAKGYLKWSEELKPYL